MKRSLAVLVATVLLAGTAALVGAGTGPLADAGLDQKVQVDTTVQLDGTGSSHPNGTIDDYQWSIETPERRTIRPDCAGCPRPQFTPHEPGRYNVTLTVTDAEGRSDTDTLFVYVEAAGPNVTLDGPTEPPLDERTSFNASAETANAELETLTWHIGNETVAREPMNGNTDRTNRSVAFSDPGIYVIEVVVRDSNNRTARDALTVEPRLDLELVLNRGPDSGTNGSNDDVDYTDGRNDSTPTCGISRRVATSGYACVGTVGGNESQVGVGAAYSSLCTSDNVSCHGNFRSESGGTRQGIGSRGGTGRSEKPIDNKSGRSGGNGNERYTGTDSGRVKPGQSDGF